MSEGLKLVVRGTMAGSLEWRNVFYGTGSGDFNDARILAWVTELYNTVLPHTSNGLHIYGVDVSTRLAGYVDTDPIGWGASDVVAVNLTGADAGEVLPPFDSKLVIAKTGVKHVMGRKFIPSIPEAQQSWGTLTAAVIAELNAFAEKWATPTSLPLSGSWTPCVWGKVHGFTPIIGAIANEKVFHMSSRAFGRGI